MTPEPKIESNQRAENLTPENIAEKIKNLGDQLSVNHEKLKTFSGKTYDEFTSKMDNLLKELTSLDSKNQDIEFIKDKYFSIKEKMEEIIEEIKKINNKENSTETPETSSLTPEKLTSKSTETVSPETAEASLVETPDNSSLDFDPNLDKKGLQELFKKVAEEVSEAHKNFKEKKTKDEKTEDQDKKTEDQKAETEKTSTSAPEKSTTETSKKPEDLKALLDVELLLVKLNGVYQGFRNIDEASSENKKEITKNTQIQLNEIRKKLKILTSEKQVDVSTSEKTEDQKAETEKTSTSAPEKSSPEKAETFSSTPEKLTAETNKKLEDLKEQLLIIQEDLAQAFVKKEEKTEGVVGAFNKMFRKTATVEVYSSFDDVWEKYQTTQKEIVELSQLQSENVRKFLTEQMGNLKEEIAKHYKTKENVVVRAYRKLGEMNLFNLLKAQEEKVKNLKDSGSEVGKWDQFWANRAEELEKSSKISQFALKTASVRTLTSVALLAGGGLGVVGAAQARGAMVGLGASFSARQTLDLAFKPREDFFSSKEEAEEYYKRKYGIEQISELADEKTIGKIEKKNLKTEAKVEKKLKSIEEKIQEFEGLSIQDKLNKIQEKITSLESYGFVNNLDLKNDENYQRLLKAKESLITEFDKSIDLVKNEQVEINSDNIGEVMTFLKSKEDELDVLAKDISSKKRRRWAKRVVAATVGVAAGAFAYLAVLRKAELYSGDTSTTINESLPASSTSVEDGLILESEPLESEPKIETPVITTEEALVVDPEKISSIDHYLKANISKEEIENATLVHKGDGIERIIQRQLKLDPKSFGYEGDLADAKALKKWIGHEASVIAQKQNVADKYFIFNEKDPQHLILKSDKTIEISSNSKLHHISEIASAKARKIAELGEIRATTDSGEVISLKPDIQDGRPGMFTDLEKITYDELVKSESYDDAMDLLIKSKERGPIFELPDGSKLRQMDLIEKGYILDSSTANLDSSIDLSNSADSVDTSTNLNAQTEAEKIAQLKRQIVEISGIEDLFDGDEDMAKIDTESSPILAKQVDSLDNKTQILENIDNKTEGAKEVIKNIYDERFSYNYRINQLKDYLQNIESNDIISLDGKTIIQDNKLNLNGINYYLDGDSVKYEIPNSNVKGLLDSSEKMDLLKERYQLAASSSEDAKLTMGIVDQKLNNLNEAII